MKEYCLFIECVWRLEFGKTVLTGWNESPDINNGNLTKQITTLKEDFIDGVELSDFYDLKITFKSGKILNVFCDVTPHSEPSDYDENWSLCNITLNQCFCVNRNFQIDVTKWT